MLAVAAASREAQAQTQAQVVRFSPVAVSGPRFANPHNLVLSLDKSLLFVADLGNDRLKILNPQTLETIDVLGQGDLTSPHDVTLDNRGRILVADTGNHRVVLYRIFGTKARIVGMWDQGLSSPEGVAVDDDGAVYVTNVGFNNVVKFVQGKPVRQVGGKGTAPGRFVRPHDVALDSQGRVYVADSGNNRIQILDKNLNFTRELKGPSFDFNEPAYLKLDLNGWLYVTDQYSHQVKIFDADFRFRGVIGSGVPGRKHGQLKGPKGIEVWGDNVWVSDTDNSRVLLFRRQ